MSFKHKVHVCNTLTRTVSIIVFKKPLYSMENETVQLYKQINI